MMKTILVLDDEVTLRGPMCRLLYSHGYRTLEAGDGEEAIRRFQQSDRSIDLLIADVCLPIGSGVQVAVTLREHLPQLPVILASGYPLEMWKARDFALLGKIGPDSVSILHKPIGAPTLLATIGRLIGKGQPEAARTA